MRPLHHLARRFPKLAVAGYFKTSDATGIYGTAGSYNCIAWAANDERRWWWPDSDAYWPPWIKHREPTVACFVKTFKSLGYRVCANSDREPGYDKVVLYAIHNSRKQQMPPQQWQDMRDWAPTHMARQLPDGTWTSKCGGNEDITHLTLDAVESYGPWWICEEYGCPIVYMKRLTPVSGFVALVQRIAWRRGWF